jgi:tetratricopeptide (TPR) repeat protein
MAKAYLSLLWGFVFGLGFLGAAPGSPQMNGASHSITLRGQVQTEGGQVIPIGVTVTLQTSAGMPVQSRPVDSNGAFEFVGLAAEHYTLRVRAENFQPFEQSLDFSNGWAEYHVVTVVLVPLDKSKASAAAPPPLTDEAAPKSARKEFEKGARAWREKNLTGARRHLEKAVAEYPCYARAQTALAEIDQAEKKPASAETRYKQAIHCDGTYLDPFLELAQLYMAENKPQDSEAILSQGLRVSPAIWLLHYELANAHSAMGKYQEAVKDFLTAESFHPDMPAEFHARLANTYLQMREDGKALGEIDTYLRLSPNGRYAKNAKKIAEVLRSDGVTTVDPQAAVSSTGKP